MRHNPVASPQDGTPTKQASDKTRPRNRCGSLWAKMHRQDNETPALNALKALCGAPISMGRGEIPWSCGQQPSVFCLFYFKQAVRWEIIARNPFDNVVLPKTEYKKRDIWTADIICTALDQLRTASSMLP